MMIFCAALLATVTIQSGTRISCDVSMAQPKSVFLSTGRQDEGLRFSLRKDGIGYDWSVREAFGGKRAMVRSSWAGRRRRRSNGIRLF